MPQGAILVAGMVRAAALVVAGAMPVIVAAALTCEAMQRFDYVAFLDPRLKRFVVSASRLATRPVGVQL